MPKYVFQNLTTGNVLLPSPIALTLKSQEYRTIDTHAVNVDTPAMQALIDSKLIRVAPDTIESPYIDDCIEIPVVCMDTGGSPVGEGFNKIGNELVATGDPNIWNTPDNFIHVVPGMTLALYWNGVRQALDCDYTVVSAGVGLGSGVNTIFTVRTGDILLADYRTP